MLSTTYGARGEVRPPAVAAGVAPTAVISTGRRR